MVFYAAVASALHTKPRAAVGRSGLPPGTPFSAKFKQASKRGLKNVALYYLAGWLIGHADVAACLVRIRPTG